MRRRNSSARIPRRDNSMNALRRLSREENRHARGGVLLLPLLLSLLLLSALTPAHASLRSQGLLPASSALPGGSSATATATTISASPAGGGGGSAVVRPMGLFGRLRKWWRSWRNKKPPTSAATGACQKSSLTGFTSSVDLSGTGLILHWNVVAAGGTQLDMALEAKGATLSGGWFAVGWSPDGSMAGSDAAIANLAGGAPEYDTYEMTAQSMAGVTTTTAFTLGSAPSFTVNAGTNAVLTFSRSTGDGGTVPVNVAGSNSIVWAYSADGTTTLADHGTSNRGSSSIDFTCDGTKVATMCPASTLTGYDYQTNLGGNNLIMHWKAAAASAIDFALEAKGTVANGWVSMAVGASSRMSPADAVIGNLAGGAVGAYALTSSSASGVNPGSFSIGTAATTTSPSGSTLVTFTRTQGSGRIQVDGVNTILWAYSGSQSQALTTHGGNKGSLLVDLSCRTKPKCVKRKILFWKCKRNRGGDDDDDDDDHDRHH